jgi:hypothetical protein
LEVQRIWHFDYFLLNSNTKGVFAFLHPPQTCPLDAKKKKRLLECLHKRLDLVRMMLKSPPSHASGECSNWLFRGDKPPPHILDARNLNFMSTHGRLV